MSERKFYIGAQNDMLYIISGRAPAANNDYPVHGCEAIDKAMLSAAPKEAP